MNSCSQNVLIKINCNLCHLQEVAILTPSEELIGECQSNVEFICLSVKVKYNFYDPNGNRLLKMTGIMAEEGSADKFMVNF